MCIRDSGTDCFLILHNDGAQNFELISVPVDDPDNRTVIIAHREDTRLDDIDVFAGQVIVSLRRDALARIAIMKVPVDDPDNRTVIIAHREDTRLDDIDVFAGQVIVSLRRDALARIAIMKVAGGGLSPLTEIDFGAELFTSGVGGNAEWDQPLVRVGFGSFITPSTIYDYVVDTGELILRKQAVVLGGYEPDDYEQHRSWAKATDGTMVPVSIVCRKDTPRDGSAPGLIYGYGSYEASMDPGFGVARLSLLDRGFVYAVAHVRGGVN